MELFYSSIHHKFKQRQTHPPCHRLNSRLPSPYFQHPLFLVMLLKVTPLITNWSPWQSHKDTILSFLTGDKTARCDSIYVREEESLLPRRRENLTKILGQQDFILASHTSHSIHNDCLWVQDHCLIQSGSDHPKEYWTSSQSRENHSTKGLEEVKEDSYEKQCIEWNDQTCEIMFPGPDQVWRSDSQLWFSRKQHTLIFRLA